MYFPYLRAKQNDLAAITELDNLIHSSESVIPIIEPVAKKIKAPQFTRVANTGIPFIIVSNPIVGPYSNISTEVERLISNTLGSYDNCIVGFIIKSTTTIRDVRTFIRQYPSNRHAFIHFHEFADRQTLFQEIATDANGAYNIYIDNRVGLGYIDAIANVDALDILIRDGFNKRDRNADYPDYDFYYDLHRSYNALNFDGFGDFTILGESFEGGGGPAYVVALHLTDQDVNSNIIMRHFKSDNLVPPSSANPGGKFRQALDRLHNHLTRTPTLTSAGIEEFRDLHHTGHYPGLGIAKKISIKHHIEFIYEAL